MKSIKGLIFDLDYTLYDESTYFFVVIKEFCKRHNLSWKQVWNGFSYEKRVNSKDILRDILTGAKLYSKDYHDELFALYSTINVSLELYTGAKSLLALSKERAVKTAVITNGNVLVQRNKIRCLAIDELIDIIICARELGQTCDKPHPLPFLTCIEKMGLSADNVLYVGDNPVVDIGGTHNAGVSGILMTQAYQAGLTSEHFHSQALNCQADYIVSNFRELKSLLFTG